MITPIGITLKDVVQAGLDAIPQSEWHTEREENWAWHASGLANCPRQQILYRANGRTDPQTESSKLVLNLGTQWHSTFEVWLQAYQAQHPEMQIVVQEIGFRHSKLNLAAKPDALICINGRNVLIDFKTEHENAAKRRRDDAKAADRDSAAKPEHAIQLTATAMCLEDAGYKVDEGRIWYMTKAQAWYSEEPVDVHSPALRLAVKNALHVLDTAWLHYQNTQALPVALDAKSWQCKPQSDSHFGAYCPVRSVCRGYGAPSEANK